MLPCGPADPVNPKVPCDPVKPANPLNVNQDVALVAVKLYWDPGANVINVFAACASIVHPELG
jgi:hypothetical protein